MDSEINRSLRKEKFEFVSLTSSNSFSSMFRNMLPSISLVSKILTASRPLNVNILSYISISSELEITDSTILAKGGQPLTKRRN